MYVRALNFTKVRQSLDRPSLTRRQGLESLEKPFGNLLERAAESLRVIDQEAAKAQMEMVTGNARDLHTAVLAVEKSSLALDLVISVRNKALEAYQEIMRMPV